MKINKADVITFMGFGIFAIGLVIDTRPVIDFAIVVIGSVVAIFGMYLVRRNDRKLKDNDKETLL